jgi:hypothetical protein
MQLAKMVAYPLSQFLAEIPEESRLFRAGREPIQRDEQICGEFSQKNFLYTILMNSARRSRSFMLLYANLSLSQLQRRQREQGEH